MHSLSDIQFEINKEEGRCNVVAVAAVSSLVADFIMDFSDSIVFEFLENPEKFNSKLGCNGDIYIAVKDERYFIEGEVYDPESEKYELVSGEICPNQFRGLMRRWMDITNGSATQQPEA